MRKSGKIRQSFRKRAQKCRLIGKTQEFFQNVVFVYWEVLCFGKNLLEQAVAFAYEHSADLEDVMQCLCAKQNDCTYIITNDPKFCDCGVEVFDVGRFLLVED